MPAEALITPETLRECERRAIQLYYTEKDDTPVKQLREQLVNEFGETVVTQMLANGIGNNGN